MFHLRFLFCTESSSSETTIDLCIVHLHVDMDNALFIDWMSCSKTFTLIYVYTNSHAPVLTHINSLVDVIYRKLVCSATEFCMQWKWDVWKRTGGPAKGESMGVSQHTVLCVWSSGLHAGMQLLVKPQNFQQQKYILLECFFFALVFTS